MMQISFGVSNSTVLMKSWASAPMIAAGRKAIRMPSTKRRVRAVARQVDAAASTAAPK